MRARARKKIIFSADFGKIKKVKKIKKIKNKK
jgi:hypothetical protein